MHWRLSLFIAFSSLVATAAFAKPELVARASNATESQKIIAELYYDKESKHADLWVDYAQGGDDDKMAFKATSLNSRLHDAQVMLAPHPAVRIETMVTQIYDGYDVKDGLFNKNAGFALLVRYPARMLPDSIVETLAKQFPKSVVYDDARRPLYFKSVLTRISARRVYPVLAFDQELDLSTVQ